MILPLMTTWAILCCLLHLFLRLNIIFYYRDLTDNKQKADWANLAYANCQSQAVIYVPLVFFIAISYGDYIGAGLGLYYLLANILYAVGYTRDANSRATGFNMYFFMTWIIGMATLATMGYSLLALSGWLH